MYENGVTQQDYADAFGVELPQEDGEQEAGSGAAENGGAAQEPEAGGRNDGAGMPEEDTPAELEKPAEQSAEERRRQAYGRRAREREAERQAMTAAAQARVDAVYADLFKGQVNPYTNQPIRSEADFRAYREAMERQERQQQLQNAGVDPAVA